jgi:hypothetical protein
MRRRSRGRRQRNSNQRNDLTGLGSAYPDPRGDIPRPIKRTYETHSCALPKLTQMCTFRQIAEPNTIVASASSAVSGTLNFQLSNLDGASALAIWDQYRIECIRLTVIPANNAIGLQTATNILVPLYVVIDYDDSTALGSQAQARKYDNCIILEPAESCCRVFKPRAAIAAYAGAFNNFINVPSPWIDTVSSGVQHYGIKYYVPLSAGTVLQEWEIQAEYFISFRSLIA